MIRAHHIGTTTVQGPAHDMPCPFDPQAHIPPQERAAQGRDAVSANADSRGATLPSEAAHSEATGHLQNANVAQANADRAQIAALGEDPVPAARRSPLEHERDAGPRESTADMIARLRNPGAWVSPDDLARLIALVDELLLRSARQFALAHEAGRAVEGGE